MNFYKHHIGDYAQATAHLSFAEDAAYSRLLRKYYAEEKPIPADIKVAQRLVAARSREEREAVETVLSEFFVLEDDGWHNKRADEELARWKAQAEANRRVAEEREARRRARLLNDQDTNRCNEGNESCDESLNESSQSREPNQKPEARSQKRAKASEPIGSGAPSCDGAPIRSAPIPYQAIVDAYNRTLTGLPKVRELTAKRRTLIRSAWQAAAHRQSLEFWIAYFAECQDDPFLNGTGPYGNGHENWRPNFDYLLRADVVTRTFERALDRMEREA